MLSDPYNQKGQPDKTFFSEIDMQETVAIENLIHFSGIPIKSGLPNLVALHYMYGMMI